MRVDIGIGAQIEEAEREVRLREGVYTRDASSAAREDALLQSVSDMHLERMRAIVRTLKWVQSLHEERKEG